MSESLNLKTLLPPNATDQERALEAAVFRATDLPVEINTLWNPQACPAQLLPWLAWSLSVDEWDPQWTEEIKRSVIAASVGVHLVKGSVASVRRVLAAVGVPAARLTEWFQTPADPVLALVHSTDPYTYTVGLDVVGSTQPLTPTLYGSIFRLLGHTQPARCGMALYLDARSGSAVGVGSAARLMQFARFVFRPAAVWVLLLDYTDAADPAPWALTLDYTDLANPAPWALTLGYTDLANPAPWVLTLDYTDLANPAPWVLTLDYSDLANPAPWTLTLDYSDDADLASWVLTLNYTDNAEI